VSHFNAVACLLKLAEARAVVSRVGKVRMERPQLLLYALHIQLGGGAEVAELLRELECVRCFAFAEEEHVVEERALFAVVQYLAERRERREVKGLRVPSKMAMVHEVAN
jgi:hypothetical protein